MKNLLVVHCKKFLSLELPMLSCNHIQWKHCKCTSLFHYMGHCTETLQWHCYNNGSDCFSCSDCNDFIVCDCCFILLFVATIFWKSYINAVAISPTNCPTCYMQLGYYDNWID